MGVKTVLMFLFLLATLGLHFSQVRATISDTGVIRVPHDFQTIQSAIDAAQNGSTILVDGGVYYEHLTVNKTLTLLGVNKEDTIVDGSYSGDVVVITGDNVLFSGFTVRNSSGGMFGIYLSHSEGSTVTGNVVTLYNGLAGIEVDDSDNNTVSDNIVSSTTGTTFGLFFGIGIELESSANNIISDNVITDWLVGGVNLALDHDNSILRNVIENNGVPMTAQHSNHDTISQNNFIHNQSPGGQIYSDNMMWSMGGKGNYWDDYVGLDDGSGGRTAGDGVGDTNLPWHEVDDYPLISPVNPLQIFWNDQAFPSSLISNSTVPAFTFNQTHKEITFNLLGPANTTGYFNLSTPAALLSGPWTVLLDGHDVTSEAAITENQTHSAIYLSYSHSSHSVQIIGTHVIPEYPTLSILVPATLLASILAALITKKTRNRLPKCQKQNHRCKRATDSDTILRWLPGVSTRDFPAFFQKLYQSHLRDRLDFFEFVSLR